MLKTLKWVYELGYKHAENKLYHQLIAKASDLSPTAYEMSRVEDKSDYEKKELRQRQELSWRLKGIINDTFNPNAQMSVEEIERNRFEL